MPNAKKRAGYSQKDLRDVSDNPELTKADFARAAPFAEVFPDLAASIRKGVRPEQGALAFAGVVLITMIAAQTFDTRTMWQAARAQPDAAA